MKIFRVLSVLFFTLLVLKPVFASESLVVVTDGWTRISNTKTSASYMTIKNIQDKDVILVSASSDFASIVELHKTVTENNISQMVPINRLVIPAHDEVLLKPKGLHIMLIGLKKPLVKGEVVPISLHFENMGPVTVNTIVK
ncbi:MAG: copper chaperone PCu(A)C [Rickettsiales bacterium]|nr:copper chaperone PCu(A)C [Rickettsiales bacterium]